MDSQKNYTTVKHGLWWGMCGVYALHPWLVFFFFKVLRITSVLQLNTET